MNKTKPLNQVRSIDADLLNHITKVQNKSKQEGSILSLFCLRHEPLTHFVAFLLVDRELRLMPCVAVFSVKHIGVYHRVVLEHLTSSLKKQ